MLEHYCLVADIGVGVLNRGETRIRLCDCSHGHALRAGCISCISTVSRGKSATVSQRYTKIHHAVSPCILLCSTVSQPPVSQLYHPHGRLLYLLYLLYLAVQACTHLYTVHCISLYLAVPAWSGIGCTLYLAACLEGVFRPGKFCNPFNVFSGLNGP